MDVGSISSPASTAFQSAQRHQKGKAEMPRSDTYRTMAVKRVKDAEEMFATLRSQADPVLVELLRQLINSAKNSFRRPIAAN